MPQADAARRGMNDSTMLSVTKGARLGVSMPDDISEDPLQREIWEWIAPAMNHFTEQDMPQLRELVTWHAVFETAREAIMDGDGMTVLGENGKKHPAISVMKEASSEIRALSDHLGLSPLSRSRLGLMQATTTKTAAETAAMFTSGSFSAAIDAAYPELAAAYAELESVE